MLMVAEMTGSLSILTPALVGVGIAWLIVRQNDDTIYRSQIKNGPIPRRSGSWPGSPSWRPYHRRGDGCTSTRAF